MLSSELSLNSLKLEILSLISEWQRAKHPRTREIVNVACKAVDVSDF